MGTDLLEAFCRLETMAHTALITKLARDMGSVKTLPSEEAVRLRQMGLKRYGGPPSAVAKADEPGADLPEACLSCSGCSNPSPTGVGPEVDLRLARVLAGSPQADATPSKRLNELVTEELMKALGRTGPA